MIRFELSEPWKAESMQPTITYPEGYITNARLTPGSQHGFVILFKPSANYQNYTVEVGMGHWFFGHIEFGMVHRYIYNNYARRRLSISELNFSPYGTYVSLKFSFELEYILIPYSRGFYPKPCSDCELKKFPMVYYTADTIRLFTVPFEKDSLSLTLVFHGEFDEGSDDLIIRDNEVLWKLVLPGKVELYNAGQVFFTLYRAYFWNSSWPIEDRIASIAQMLLKYVSGLQEFWQAIESNIYRHARVASSWIKNVSTVTDISHTIVTIDGPDPIALNYTNPLLGTNCAQRIATRYAWQYRPKEMIVLEALDITELPPPGSVVKIGNEHYWVSEIGYSDYTFKATCVRELANVGTIKTNQLRPRDLNLIQGKAILGALLDIDDKNKRAKVKYRNSEIWIDFEQIVSIASGAVWFIP